MITIPKSIVKPHLDQVLCLVIALLIVMRYSGDFLPFNLTFVYLIVVSLLGFRFFGFKYFKEEKTYPSFVAIVLFFSLLFIMSLSVFTPTPRYALNKLFFIVTFGGIGYIYRFYLAKYYTYFANSLVFWTVLILGTYSIFFPQDMITQVLENEVGGRLALTENTNPIVVATLFAVGFILLFDKIQLKISRYFVSNLSIQIKNIIFLSMLIAVGMFLFFTGSRGVMLAIIMAIFAFYFFKIKFAPPLLIFFLLLSALAYPFLKNYNSQELVLSVTPKWSHLFILKRFYAERSGESIDIRRLLYAKTWRGFKEAPVHKKFFGHGFGAFGYLYSGGKDRRMYPHNIQLEILYEVGIAGLVLFSYITLIPFYMQWKIRDPVHFSSLFMLYYFFFFKALSTADLGGNFPIFFFLFIILSIYAIPKNTD